MGYTLSAIEDIEAVIAAEKQMRIDLFRQIEQTLECIQPEDRLNTERQVSELQVLIAKLKKLTLKLPQD
jgi:hypothetical protein